MAHDNFLIKLLATFRVEADEHLRALSTGLLELEKAPADGKQADIVEKIFRETHSLKGAARAVNFTEIESACQALESVFAALKRKEIAVSPALFDLLHQAADTLNLLLAADPTTKPATVPLIRRLEDALRAPASVREDSPSPQAESAPPQSVAAADMRIAPAAPGLLSETVRISVTKLNSVMRQSEELLVPRLAAGQRARELRETSAMFADWKKQWAGIRPALRAMERSAAHAGRENATARVRQAFARLFDYLDAESLFAKTLEARLARLGKSAEHDHRALAGMVDGLLHDVKEMHLLPFSSLLEVFPRFVRELARDQGKLVDLAIHGGELEIDRRILEEMKDALIHMIRNCIDHGIETPAAREQKQKSPRGTITLVISQQDSGKAEVLVADDGAGIDAGQVKAAALKLGLVSAEEAARLGEHEALMFAFQSGISTSPIITDVSGHGLGLAIVREKVERLGGAVAIESHPDAGTTFRIVLPLSLANFRGVLVDAGGQRYERRYSTNADGFRSFGDVSATRRKLFVIGDSYTQAVDVSDDRTYHALLGKELNLEVFAIGVGGFGTLQELILVDDWVDRVKPDVVLLQLAGNDFINNDYDLERASLGNNNALRRPYLGTDGQVFYAFPRPWAAVRQWGNEHSHFLVFAFYRLDSIERRRRAGSGSIETEIANGGESHPAFARAVRTTEELLRRIRARCGSRPVFAFQVDGYEPSLTTFRRLAGRNGIGFLDGVPEAVTASSSAGSNPWAADGGHWNELGHRIAARTLEVSLHHADLAR
jgi:chemotaxis protein histidine kinase CheA